MYHVDDFTLFWNFEVKSKNENGLIYIFNKQLCFHALLLLPKGIHASTFSNELFISV